MRCIPALLMYIPARKLSEMYDLVPFTILRIDREELESEVTFSPIGRNRGHLCG